jgi:hypothetical protein
MLDKSKGKWLHESNRNIKRITAWSVNVVWSDGTEEVLTDIPDYVATEVDAWLTGVEEDNTPEESEDE